MDLVGLTHVLRIPKSLKREALIFNRVAVYGADNIHGGRKLYDKELLKELDWLLDQGIVELLGRSLVIGELEAKLFRKVLPAGNELGQLELYDFFSRIACLNLRQYKSIDAYPIFYTDLFTQNNQTTNKGDVIQILMNFLPVPDDHTSWDQIIEYRSDPDTMGKFLALKRWMNNLAKSKLTPQEIEEELEWLIYDYKRHLNLHKLRYKVGAIETFITVAAEVLENLIKVNWGKAAKQLFEYKHKRIALLEAEIKSPGSEVAYIIKSHESFGDRT